MTTTMEQLSVEEKAKRYDEAKLRMSKAFNDNRCTIGFMNEIFPELKESEDEKIRKILVEKINSLNPTHYLFDNISKDKILVWLENQNDESETYEEMFETAKRQGYKEGLRDGRAEVWKQLENSNSKEDNKIREYLIKCVCRMTPQFIAENAGLKQDNIIFWLNRQSVQKPVKKVEAITNDSMTEFQKQVSYLIASIMNKEYEYTQDYVEWVAQELLGFAQHVQKPVEWSEEDAAHYNRILKELNLQKEMPINASVIEEVKSDIIWLKSLKGRVQPQPKQVLDFLDKLRTPKDKVQPKQEWSEEDDEKRKGLIKGLEDRMGFGWASDPFSREEYIDWLKSLRPQSTWKPSDEQMDALRYVTNFDYGGHKATLVSLYEQLKKLKG